jgi:hypothetical protein
MMALLRDRSKLAYTALRSGRLAHAEPNRAARALVRAKDEALDAARALGAENLSLAERGEAEIRLRALLAELDSQ